MNRITIIEGNVVELARYGAPSGKQLIRVKVAQPRPFSETYDKRLNVYVLPSEAEGLALGTKVRITMEVQP